MKKEKSPPADDATPGPAAPATPTARIHRGRIGLNVFVQLLLGVLIFALVNYLAIRRYKQWDYTLERNFTLADSTAEFLRKLSLPVRATVLTIRGSVPEKDLSALLDQYKQETKGRLEVQFIDTRRDVQAWEEFKARMARVKIPITENGILIEAGNPVTVADNAADAPQPGVDVSDLPRRWIPESVLYEVDPQTKTPIAFRGESMLNTAIRAVASIDRPTVALVSGLGPLRTTQDGTFFNTMREIAAKQNVAVEVYNVLDDAEIGASVQSLVLLPTRFDLGDREEEIFRKFFETPGRSLIVFLNPLYPTPRLDAFLTTYGIVPQNDRVLSVTLLTTGPQKNFAVDARFLDGSPITQGIVSERVLFAGQTRSLKIIEGSDKQRTENIEVKPLLSPPAEEFWGERKYNEALPVLDVADGDNGPPLYIAATAERGAAKDPRVQLQSSRMLVFGNSQFCDPDSITPPNYDLFTRALNWSLHRDVVAPNDSSTDKRKQQFRIRIRPEQWQRIFITTTIILPLAALLTGLIIWSSRRS